MPHVQLKYFRELFIDVAQYKGTETLHLRDRKPYLVHDAIMWDKDNEVNCFILWLYPVARYLLDHDMPVGIFGIKFSSLGVQLDFVTKC